MHFVKVATFNYCCHCMAVCLLVAPNLIFHSKTVLESAKCKVPFL